MPNNLYNDLPLTNFPSSLDTFTTWLNVTATDGPLIQQYITAMNAGNQTLANQILSQISSASQKIITATDLNTMTQAIQAVERFYLTDIEPYIATQQESWLSVINQFTYKGEWQSGTGYVTNNIVSYTVSGVNLLFIATSNPPTGTVPTNTTYWRVLTIQGQQGTSGVGLSYRQEWNNSTLYNVNDAVTYSQAIWMATAQNQNQRPTEGSSYWKLVMTLTATQYPIQDTEPQNLAAGDLWFNTQDNPTKYYYLAGLDNPITQEMIPVGYQTYGEKGVVLNGTGPLPIASGGTGATTPQGALANLGAGVRPNIIRNPDFKINQRQFSNTNWTSGYGPDGWASIGSGHLEYTGGAVKTFGQYLLQFFEQGVIKAGTYTISAICTGEIKVELGYFTGVSKNVESSNYQNGIASVIINVDADDDAKNGFAYIRTIDNGGEISYVKLEQGDSQTIAYQDSDGVCHLLPQPESDYATQLAKCQRYYAQYGVVAANVHIGYAMATTSTISNAIIFLPGPMRITNPTVSFGGTVVLRSGVTDVPVSGMTINSVINNAAYIQVTASGLESGKMYVLRISNGYIAFDADL